MPETLNLNYYYGNEADQYSFYRIPKILLTDRRYKGVSPALVKKIGRTTYIVRVHFSKTSKETMSDKIKRMLKNEIRQM